MFPARLKSCPFKTLVGVFCVRDKSRTYQPCNVSVPKGNRRSFDSLPLRQAQGPVAQDDSAEGGALGVRAETRTYRFRLRFGQHASAKPLG